MLVTYAKSQYSLRNVDMGFGLRPLCIVPVTYYSILSAKPFDCLIIDIIFPASITFISLPQLLLLLNDILGDQPQRQAP
jgi:hypothetical protein